jgi:DNA-binding response OmpR family regulator
MAFAEEVKTTLQAYGASVSIVGDGTQGLEKAHSEKPNLILLCVELPQMSGYIVCNKLKKNPELKDIRLIIMSSAASPDTFEQHKKLKTRADDYLLKPFQMAELLNRVQQFITLPNPSSFSPPDFEQTHCDQYLAEGIEVVSEEGKESPPEQSQEINIEDSSEDEYEIEDDYILDEELKDGEIARIDLASDLDHDIALATDAAFAALELPGIGPEHAPSEDIQVMLPSEAATDEAMLTSGEPITAPPVVALEVDEASGEGDEIELEESTVERRLLQEKEDQGKALTQEGAEASSLKQVATSSAEEERLKHRLAQLEEENRRLSEELQRARSTRAPGGTSASRERELLDLRETINRKEKEILDLRDDVDAKERQNLDHKDKIRELEHKIRDMDEKLLRMEREIMTSQEKVQGLEEDKLRLGQNEKNSIEQLEQATSAIEQVHHELQELKRKGEEALQRKESELAETIQAGQQALAVLTDEKNAEIQGLNASHQRAREQLTEEHAQALEQSQRAHEEALRQLEQAQAQKLQELEQQLKGAEQTHRQALEEQGKAHQREKELEEKYRAHLAVLEDEHRQVLANLSADQANALEMRQAQQSQELGQMQEKCAAELAALKEEHQAALEQQRQQYQVQLAALKNEHQQQSDTFAQTQQGQLANLSERHRGEIETLAVQFKREKEELLSQIKYLGHDLNDLKKKLTDTENVLSDAQQHIQLLHSDLNTSKDTVANQQETIRQQESQAEALKGQLSQVFTKMQNDDALVEKAKRAMAVAITLLEEQKKVIGEEAKPPLELPPLPPQ